MEYAFDKYPPSEVTTFNVPYNYRSIMHYDSGAFSSNGQPTMISKVISKDTNCTYRIKVFILKVSVYVNMYVISHFLYRLVNQLDQLINFRIPIFRNWKSCTIVNFRLIINYSKINIDWTFLWYLNVTSFHKIVNNFCIWKSGITRIQVLCFVPEVLYASTLHLNNWHPPQWHYVQRTDFVVRSACGGYVSKIVSFHISAIVMKISNKSEKIEVIRIQTFTIIPQ